jgi:hypothetical protein
MVDVTDVVSELLAAGQRDFHKGALDAAQHEFETVTRIQPDNVQGWVWLGRTLNRLEKMREFLLQMRRAREAMAADDEELLQLLGDALHSNGHVLEAIRVWQEACASPEHSFELEDRLAGAEFHTGDLRQCIGHVRQAIQRGMRNRDYIISYGVSAAILLGEFPLARGFLDDLSDTGREITEGHRIAVAEKFWREQEKRVAPLQDGKSWFAVFDRALKDGDFDAAAYLVGRYYDSDVTTSEASAVFAERLKFFQHGLPGAAHAVVSLAYKTARNHPDGAGLTPDFILGYSEALAAKGHIHDATQLLVALVAREPVREHASHILRLLTSSCGRGGMEPAQLETATRQLAPQVTDAGIIITTERFMALASSDPRRILTAIQAERPDAPAAELAPLVLEATRPRRSVRRPRLAICVSGQLRSFLQCWPLTRDALAGWDTETFVFTWENTGAGIGRALADPRQELVVDRVIPKVLVDALPRYMRRQNAIEKRYPGLATLLTSGGTAVRAEVEAVFETSHVEIGDEDTFDASVADSPGLKFLGAFNQAKMFYGISRVQQMRQAAEQASGQRFDSVIRIRPDRALRFLSTHDVARTQEERIYLAATLPGIGVDDQLGLMSTDVADRLENLWPILRKAGSPRCLPGFTGGYNEYLLGQYLVYCGARAGKFEGTRADTLRSIEHSLGAIWSALVTDLAAKSDIDDDDREFTRICFEFAQREDAGLTPPAWEWLSNPLGARV